MTQDHIAELKREHDDARVIWRQIIAQNQQISAQADKLFALLQMEKGRKPEPGNTGEQSKRIAELENIVRIKEQQFNAISRENQEIRRRSDQVTELYNVLQLNYKHEKENTSRLSLELEKAELRIQNLREIVSNLECNGKKTSDTFLLTVNKSVYMYNADNIEAVINRISDTASLDAFFKDVDDDNSYKKMFERFKKHLCKEIGKCGEDDELEDVMNSLVSVIDRDFLRKIMVAVYRGKKAGKAEFEEKLLMAVNTYLEAAGFYCRENILTGNKVQNEDFGDMEIIKADIAGQHGEIAEIEIYPYYVNYIDEDGNKRKVHTEGRMIVAG